MLLGVIPSLNAAPMITVLPATTGPIREYRLVIVELEVDCAVFAKLGHKRAGFSVERDQPVAGTDLAVHPYQAVAVPTKQGFLYVFDRVTGKPVWPIEERPATRGDVPVEWYSPTQPIPTRPAAYARNGISVDDLIDFTPALRDEARTLIAKYKIGPYLRHRWKAR